MSIEQQYDAWVQGLVGGKRSAAGESEAARSSLEQMQAQLDALAALVQPFLMAIAAPTVYAHTAFSNAMG